MYWYKTKQWNLINTLMQIISERYLVCGKINLIILTVHCVIQLVEVN